MGRTIYLFGAVGTEMSLRFAKRLDSLLAEDSVAPITVVINSEGGHSYDAMAIVDLMRTSGPKFNTVCIGQAFSAASIILMAGHHRSIGPGAWIMVHEETEAVANDMRTVIVDARHRQEEELQWGAHMAMLTGQTPEYWAKAAKDTTYYDAQTALELGLVDEILKDSPNEKSSRLIRRSSRIRNSR